MVRIQSSCPCVIWVDCHNGIRLCRPSTQQSNCSTVPHSMSTVAELESYGISEKHSQGVPLPSFLYRRNRLVCGPITICAIDARSMLWSLLLGPPCLLHDSVSPAASTL